LILRITGSLQSITATNAFILQRHKDALEGAGAPLIQIEGTSDLTTGGLKFSGNAQRRRRSFLLFHGTLLLSFDLSLMEELLLQPTKQPEYRRQRSHKDFLTNVDLPPQVIKETLRKCWNATEILKEVPLARIAELAKTSYPAIQSLD
jgi:lipoate-protein ligase A